MFRILILYSMVLIILQMLRMDVFEIQKLFENFSCLWEFIMIVCIDFFWEVFSYYIRFFDERLEVYEYIGRLNKVIYGLK